MYIFRHFQCSGLISTGIRCLDKVEPGERLHMARLQEQGFGGRITCV